MRRIAVREVVVHESVREATLRLCLMDLIHSVEPYKPRHCPSTISATVPSGLSFFIDLVHETEAEDILLSMMSAGITNVLRLAQRRKAHFSDILILLDVVISAAEKWTGHWSIYHFTPLKVMQFWACAAFPNVDVETELDFTPHWELRRPSNPKPEHQDDLYALMIRIFIASSGHTLSPSMLCTRLAENFGSKSPPFPPGGRLPVTQALCRYAYCGGIKVDDPLFAKVLSERVAFDIRTLDLFPYSDANWLFQCIRSATAAGDATLTRHPREQQVKLVQLPSWYQDGFIKLRWEVANGTDDNNALALKCMINYPNSFISC